MSKNRRQFFRKTSVKIGLLIIYAIAVNLLAGFIAVWFNFASLWGKSDVFLEYALPVNFTYAISHWPSLLLLCAPLLQMPDWDAKQMRSFRKICSILFLLLTYGLLEKIPFALFPAVDLFFVFIISLLVAPPTLKENPVIMSVIICVLAIVMFKTISLLYFDWKYRVPLIKQVKLGDGLYKLVSISVRNDIKELVFDLQMTRYVPSEELCRTGTGMFAKLIDSYPFDETYHRLVNIEFRPLNSKPDELAYRLGYLIENKEDDGRPAVACFLKYKN